MSVMMTSTCMFFSYARYSAVVRARRGVIILSTEGSSARFRKRTARSSAPVFSKSRMKKSASSLVIPTAANTTANGSSFAPAFAATFACLAICTANWLCGRPDAEKMGSFCPRTRVFSPSIVDTPVWMKSRGSARAYGLIGAPFMSSLFSGIIAGPLSRGSPNPVNTRPSISVETPSCMVSPRNFTRVSETLMPAVEPNTWTTAIPRCVSSTWPFFISPEGSAISTISPYAMSETPSTKTRGPAICVTVLYSFIQTTFQMQFICMRTCACFLHPPACPLLLANRVKGAVYFVSEEFYFLHLVVGNFLHPGNPLAYGHFHYPLELYAQLHCRQSAVVEAQDVLQHQVFFFHGRIGVYFVVCRLLEVVLADHFCREEYCLLLFGKRVRPDQLHYFLKLRLLLQERHCLLAKLHPVRGNVVGVIGVKRVCVKRVGAQPVECREVAALCQRRVKCEEHLGDAQRVLRDRLRFCGSC